MVKTADRWCRGMKGLAAGVMTAAAVWWMILPSLELAAHLGVLAFLPAAAGIWLGFGFVKLPGRPAWKGTFLPAALLLCRVNGALPWLLGFFAGVLLCLAVTKLIPAMTTRLDTGAFALGFTLLLALDGVLG